MANSLVIFRSISIIFFNSRIWNHNASPERFLIKDNLTPRSPGFVCDRRKLYSATFTVNVANFINKFRFIIVKYLFLHATNTFVDRLIPIVFDGVIYIWNNRPILPRLDWLPDKWPTKQSKHPTMCNINHFDQLYWRERCLVIILGTFN